MKHRSRNAFLIAAAVAATAASSAMATDYTYPFGVWDFTNYASGFVFSGGTAPSATATAASYTTFSGYGSSATGVSGAREATAAVPTYGPAGAGVVTVGMSNNYLAGSAFAGTAAGLNTSGAGSGTFNGNVFTQSISSPDIVAQVGADGSSNVNTFRVRGLGPGNGWAQQAPQYTQGMEIDIPTTGFHNVLFQTDWYITTQSVRDLQVQYSTDGVHFANASNARLINSFGDTVGTYSNGFITAPGSNSFQPSIAVDFSGVAGVDNDPNFKIRLVNAYGRTNPLVDDASSWLQVPANTTNAAAGFISLANGKLGNPLTPPGAPMFASNDTATKDDLPFYTNRAANVFGYNNSSGNWRFTNIALTGTSTNAPAGGIGNPNAADYTWSPLAGSTTFDYTLSNTLKGSTRAAFANNNNIIFGDAGVGTVLIGTATAPVITVNRVTVSNATGTYSFTGGVAGGGLTGVASINKTGAGALILSGTNSFSGGVNVTAGQLQFSDDSALGAGALTVNGGSVRIGASVSSPRDLVVGPNGATIMTPPAVTASFSGQVRVGNQGGMNKLLKSGAGALDLQTPTFLAPTGLQLGFSGASAGTVQFDLPSGNIDLWIAPEWSNATSGSILVTNNSKLTFIRTDRADQNQGGNNVYSPGTIGATGTTASITFTGVANPQQNLVPGIVATHATTLNTNNALYTAFAGQTVDLNMPVVLAANNGTGPVHGQFLFGADALNPATWDTLNINAPITGDGDVYFAIKTTHDTGYPYQILGGGGLVNVNTALTYTGNTYVSVDKPGLVRVNVDNAFPTGTRLAFGDEQLAPTLDVGGLDLNGHTLTVGSIALGPTSGGGGHYAGIVNTAVGFANLIVSGSASSTYSGGVGVPNTNAASFQTTGANTFINISTTPTFSGTQTFTGAITATGTIEARAGKIVLDQSWLPVDGFGNVQGTLAASGTGVVNLTANASSTSHAVAASILFATVSGSGSIVVKPANRASNLDRVLVANQLSISGNGLVDLGNNDAVIRVTAEATVSAYVAAGLANLTSGLSGGHGLGSSVAGTSANTYATLGVITNVDGRGGPLFTTFDDQPVGTTDVLVKYTYLGDTDLSGTVDGSDLANLFAGMYGGLHGWANGDTNYDGVVDTIDLSNLLGALQGQGGSLGGSNGGGGGAVPEPVVGLWLAAALPLASRRRRQG